MPENTELVVIANPELVKAEREASEKKQRAANKAIVDLREERTRGKRLNALIAEYAVLKMASNFQKTEK